MVVNEEQTFRVCLKAVSRSFSSSTVSVTTMGAGGGVVVVILTLTDPAFTAKAAQHAAAQDAESTGRTALASSRLDWLTTAGTTQLPERRPSCTRPPTSVWLSAPPLTPIASLTRITPPTTTSHIASKVWAAYVSKATSATGMNSREVIPAAAKLFFVSAVNSAEPGPSTITMPTLWGLPLGVTAAVSAFHMVMMCNRQGQEAVPAVEVTSSGVGGVGGSSMAGVAWAMGVGTGRSYPAPPRSILVEPPGGAWT